jgi:alkyl hydroperoxide reductase subunit AhpF
MLKIELFVSEHCLHCPPAKIALEEAVKHFDSEKIGCEIVETTYPEGRERARNYRITAVPTLVVDGEVMTSGLDTSKAIEAINLGINSKKSFFARLFGKKGKKNRDNYLF